MIISDEKRIEETTEVKAKGVIRIKILIEMHSECVLIQLRLLLTPADCTTFCTLSHANCKTEREYNHMGG